MEHIFSPSHVVVGNSQAAFRHSTLQLQNRYSSHSLRYSLLDMFSIATENNWRGEQIGDVTELLATCYLANC